MVEGILELFDGFSQGLYAEPTTDVETVSGKAPYAFSEFAQAFKQYFV